MGKIHRTPPPTPTPPPTEDSQSGSSTSNLLFTPGHPSQTTGSDPQLHLSVLDSEARQADFDKHRLKRKLSDRSPEASNMLCQMKEMFEALETRQNKKFDLILEKNEEIKKSVELLNTKYDTIHEEVATLKAQTITYETRIKTLESKVEQLERAARSSQVEIRNIPRQEPETRHTLESLVSSIGQVLGKQIAEKDIQNVYRVKTKKESSDLVVVNFLSTACKEGFIEHSKSFIL